ncbi:MAG: lipid-A-disaccharide synthase-related protein [Elainellaceae cyanobacterium]
MKLLCLSNGHGEDAIALRILQALQQHPSHPKLAALPLVGEGTAYRQHDIPVVGPVKSMPSGGFVYMDGRQLVRDVQGGLVQLTLTQIRVARAWAKSGGQILAVGDIVPLIIAWLSGAPYAFVGTAKSEYYLRDEQGMLPRQSWFERLESWSGSVYLPWERWLMSRDRCTAVFPRDTLTVDILKRWKIPAFDMGNPMMDGLPSKGDRLLHPHLDPESNEPPLTIALLPGSRSPEAYENWQQMIAALKPMKPAFPNQQVLYLAAIAPTLDLHSFYRALETQGWRRLNSSTTTTWVQGNAAIQLTQSAFARCLHQADFAIAMAGTATEQFVGLGKPAIIMPGKGPQFTPAFAEAQTRLLGPSVILAATPQRVTQAIASLMQDPDRLQLIAQNGRRRMGNPGAAQRIAQCLIERFK